MNRIFIFRFSCFVILLFSLFSCRLVYMNPLFITEWTPSKEFIEDLNSINITAVFSFEPDRTSVEQAFSLTENGSVLSGDFSWQENTITFTPFKPINYGNAYTIKFTTDAEDRYGNSLKEAFIFRFYTKTDFERPILVSHLPENNEIIEDIYKDIVLTFSEPVNKESFYNSFSINPGVNGIFIWNEDSSVCTFSPMESYTWHQEYTVLVRNTLKDTENNNISEETEFFFTPGSDTTSPFILFTGSTDESFTLLEDDPDDADYLINSGWEAFGNIKIRFSEPVKQEYIENILVFTPVWDFIVEWSDIHNPVELTLLSDERFTYAQTYTLTVTKNLSDLYGNIMDKDTLFRFEINGPESAPPEIFRINFLLNPVEDTLPELQEFGIIDLSNYNDEATGFFDIYFTLADDAVINPMSFMENFSISVTNSCALFIPVKVETENFINPVPNPAPENINKTLVRIFISIDDFLNGGIVTLKLKSGFTDSKGNPLQNTWQIILID